MWIDATDADMLSGAHHDALWQEKSIMAMAMTFSVLTCVMSCSEMQ
jgi:hypothetical protein